MLTFFLGVLATLLLIFVLDVFVAGGMVTMTLGFLLRVGIAKLLGRNTFS